MLSMIVVTLVAASAFSQGQPLREDLVRDQAFHNRLIEFFDGKLTPEQLDAVLRSYSREFEAKPYRMRGPSIEWDKLPQAQLFKLIELIHAIERPALERFFRGELTATEAAIKVAPFFLMWKGYGIDPPPNADAVWRQRLEELLQKIADFASDY